MLNKYRKFEQKYINQYWGVTKKWICRNGINLRMIVGYLSRNELLPAIYGNFYEIQKKELERRINVVMEQLNLLSVKKGRKQ